MMLLGSSLTTQEREISFTMGGMRKCQRVVLLQGNEASKATHACIRGCTAAILHGRAAHGVFLQKCLLAACKTAQGATYPRRQHPLQLRLPPGLVLQHAIERQHACCEGRRCQAAGGAGTTV